MLGCAACRCMYATVSADGEARDFDRLCAGVGVGVALQDPGLVEGVHGAPLGFAVDAEVVADVGVDERAVDVPLVLGVRDGDEERAAAGVWDGDAGVDPERHHDVLAFVVEVGEVGEVAGVGDGDGVAVSASCDERFGRGGDLSCQEQGGCGSVASACWRRAD